MPLCQSEKRTAADPHKCQRWAEQKKNKFSGKFWRLAAYIGSAEQCSHVQRRERRGVPQPDGCLQRQMKSNHHHFPFAANKERDTDSVPNRTCITGRCGGRSTAFRRKDSSTLPMLAPEQCRVNRPRVASSQHLVPAPQATKPLKRTQDKRFQLLRRSVQTS